MLDREKVIKELDKLADEVNPWKESPPLRCDIPYPLLCDALALLKERGNCENCAIAIEDRQPIVRCKDCKKRYTVLCIQEEAGNINNQDDWFCADGEGR